MNYDTHLSSDIVKQYKTSQLKNEFLIENLFESDSCYLVYSHDDTFITRGALPVKQSAELKTIDPLKSKKISDRRELGINNIGDLGIVKVDGKSYTLNHKEALYIDSGKVIFSTASADSLTTFYLKSTLTHKKYTNEII